MNRPSIDVPHDRMYMIEDFFSYWPLMRSKAGRTTATLIILSVVIPPDGA